jgi:hypothetical protein
MAKPQGLNLPSSITTRDKSKLLAMRLFRVQGIGGAGGTGGGGSPFSRLRGRRKLPSYSDNANDSLGSSIAPSDQFDILIPYKTASPILTASAPWKFLGEQRDDTDDTDVSSITTDEYRSFPQQRTSQASATNHSASSSFCCCSTTTIESSSSLPTDNTLISNSRAGPASDLAVMREIHDVPTTTTKSLLWWSHCCSSSPTECTAPTVSACSHQRVSHPSAGCRSLNRSNSLFDAAILSEEDEAEVDDVLDAGTGKTTKRLFAQSLRRRALPWKFRHKQAFDCAE